MDEEIASPQNDEQRSPSGQKRVRFWSFLQNQRVGNDLVFDVRLAAEASKQTPAAKNYCYEMLKIFEREGLIRRKHLERGQGTMITFLPIETSEASVPKTSASQTAKFSGATTFAEAIKLLDEEVKLLRREITTKKRLRSQIVAVMKKER